MSSEQLVIYFHTQLTMDNKHVNMHIPSDPKPHLSLFNHIKFETPITGPRALIELTSQNPPTPFSTRPSSRLNTRRLRRLFGTKETFSVCLFIPALARYLFTPVTHLFSPPPSPSPAFLPPTGSPLRLSLTHRRCREGKIWVTI